MKLPARNELLRIIAAAGITLLVVALAVMFFIWVFSSPDREHRRVQPLAFSSSAERSCSISASWRSILRTSSPITANITMMAVKATEIQSIYPIAASTVRGKSGLPHHCLPGLAQRGIAKPVNQRLHRLHRHPLLRDSGRHWPGATGAATRWGKP